MDDEHMQLFLKERPVAMSEHRAKLVAVLKRAAKTFHGMPDYAVPEVTQIAILQQLIELNEQTKLLIAVARR